MNKLKFITLSLLAMAAIFITSCGNDSTEDLYTDDSVDQESDDVTSDGTLQNLAFSLPADSEYYANLMELIPEGESDYLQLFLVSRTSGEKLVVKVELTHEDGELNISLVDDFGSIFTVQPYACILAALTTVDGELIEWHSDEYDSAFTTRGLYLTPLSDFSNVELTLVTTSSSSDSSFDGRGTEAFPYQIYDADGLAQLRTDIASGNTYSGIYFAIDGNIQLMSYEWEPIGTSTYYFAGTLDGGGNSIKNLTTTDSSKSYIGFFYGLHSNAVIKNLTFSDVKITGHSYIGALSAQGGCTVDAVTVTGDMSASGAIIGGLFGCGNGTLSNCESSVNISSESGEGVGGFVAYADTNITFNNCFFNGGNITGHEAVGGMVGETHGTLTLNTCGAFGDITGNHYVGGLVGIVYGDITFTDSYVGEQSAIETVTSGNCPINIRNTSSGYNIGGLIGWMTGASKGGITATITNCHLANEPSLSVDTEAILLSGVSNVGGLVGNVDNTTFTNCDFVNNGAMIKVKSSGTGIGGIMGCVTTCKFTNSTFTNTASITTTDATSIVGGVIGSIDLTSSDAGSGSTIINNNSVVSSGDCVGGCIGQIAPQSTDNKMVNFDIMCNYGNVTGQNIVGGLIGYAEKDNLHLGSGGDDERKYDIDCNVTGNGIYVGGIIGQLEVNVSTTSAYLCGDLVASVYGGNSTGGCIGYLHMEKHCDVLELCRDSQVSVTGDIGTGGFIGKLQMASTDAYLTITTEDHLISSGNTIYPASSNSSAYGGLIGLLNRDSYSSSKSTYVEFLNCYNYLQIVGGETSSNNNSGGFIGKANNTYVKIEQSCNHADISPNGTTKGGFIGYFTNDNSSDDKTLVELYISESFNAGDIISDDKRGGFVGSISNSYLNVSNSYCTGTLDGDGKYVAGFAGHCESFGSKNNIHYKFVDCFSSAKETGWGTISGDSFHKGELYFDDVYYRSSNDDPLPESNSDNDGEETVGLDIATLKTYSLSDFGFSTTYWNDEGTDALPTLKNNSGKAN